MAQVTLNPQPPLPDAAAASPSPPPSQPPEKSGPLAKGEVRQIKDSLGRTLSVRALSALDKFRLYKALGPDGAQNPPYLGTAMLARHVISIDGEALTPPLTERLVESMVDLVGDEGTAAVAEFLAQTNQDLVPTVPADAAKNS